MQTLVMYRDNSERWPSRECLRDNPWVAKRVRWGQNRRRWADQGGKAGEENWDFPGPYLPSACPQGGEGVVGGGKTMTRTRTNPQVCNARACQ